MSNKDLACSAASKETVFIEALFREAPERTLSSVGGIYILLLTHPFYCYVSIYT